MAAAAGVELLAWAWAKAGVRVAAAIAARRQSDAARGLRFMECVCGFPGMVLGPKVKCKRRKGNIFVLRFHAAPLGFAT